MFKIFSYHGFHHVFLSFEVPNIYAILLPLQFSPIYCTHEEHIFTPNQHKQIAKYTKQKNLLLQQWLNPIKHIVTFVSLFYQFYILLMFPKKGHMKEHQQKHHYTHIMFYQYFVIMSYSHSSHQRAMICHFCSFSQHIKVQSVSDIHTVLICWNTLRIILPF